MKEYVNAPDSEWRKVIGYLEKGSTFDKVATSCRKNNFKLKWRYLILREIGLFTEAGYFEEKMDESTLQQLNDVGVNIPQFYGEKIDQWQMDGFGPFAQVSVKEKITSGPFTQLTKMGVSYDIFKGDLSDDNGNAARRGIQPWAPEVVKTISNYIGGVGEPHIVVLYNTTTTSGSNYFYLVIHSGASGVRYAIGEDPDADYSFKSAYRATELKAQLQEKIVPVPSNQENPFL